MAGITTDFRRRDSGFCCSLPKYGSMKISEALHFDFSGWDLTEKMDGVTHEMRIGSSVITGEMMPDGRLFALDLPIYNGVDIRQKPRSERLARLDIFRLRRPFRPNQNEAPTQFIERILSAGGEGVVAAPLDAPFGYDIVKIKRYETFDCVVTEKHDRRRSVRVEFQNQNAGWCAILGPEFEQVSPGTIIEIAAFNWSISGKFREPRFIRLRPDKSIA